MSPALLTVAPRVVTEERRGGLVWVDARGLDAERIARSALEVLKGLGLSNVRVGVGHVPIVAEVIAWGNYQLGAGGRCWGLGAAGWNSQPAPSVSQPRASAPSPQLVVASPESLGNSPLGTLPVAVLEPDPALAALLEGIGVETCGELAELEGESVEVRLGADGVRLWKLARGDDGRLIFAPMPRELPHASLEWNDYALADTERLLFSVNALLGTVCETLLERGSLAREMTLTLALANGSTLSNAIRAGRATASRKTWLRLARAQMERMVLPAGVVGLTLQAAVVVTDEGSQGDLFDRGFATAAATEAALASLAEEQGNVIVVPENTAHPLVERRTKWVERQDLQGERGAANGKRKHPDIPVSRLTLYLLPAPRAIEAQTEQRRDHVLPTAYRDGGSWYKVLSSAGPDRVSGERWGEAYAREYFRCIADDGGMVWLYRDARADGWFIHGWWD